MECTYLLQHLAKTQYLRLRAGVSVGRRPRASLVRRQGLQLLVVEHALLAQLLDEDQARPAIRSHLLNVAMVRSRLLRFQLAQAFDADLQCRSV